MSARKHCIVLASNLAQMGCAEFVAWQVRQSGATDIPIFIASADASTTDLRHGVAEILPIEAGGFIAALPQIARLSQYTYWRLPGIAAAAKTFDRVLYLDTDMFVGGTDLLRLFEVDLRGAPIAAVRDVHQSVRPLRPPKEFRTLGLSNAPYFNAGLLLIDGPAFVKDERMSEIERLANTHSEALSAHDQSLLNIAFHANWLEISPVWNWQFSYRNKLLTPYLELELMHLAGRTKPWNDSAHELPAIVRAAYNRFTQTMDSPCRASHCGPGLASLAKHLWYRNRYQAWLDRFPDKNEGILVQPFDH